MFDRLLRSGRALRVAPPDHDSAAATTVIRAAGVGSTPPATGGNGGGSGAPWLQAPLPSAVPGRRGPREQGLPSAGQV